MKERQRERERATIHARAGFYATNAGRQTQRSRVSWVLKKHTQTVFVVKERNETEATKTRFYFYKVPLNLLLQSLKTGSASTYSCSKLLRNSISGFFCFPSAVQSSSSAKVEEEGKCVLEFQKAKFQFRTFD